MKTREKKTIRGITFKPYYPKTRKQFEKAIENALGKELVGELKSANKDWSKDWKGLVKNE